MVGQDGECALHKAAALGEQECVAELLNQGADFDVRNKV